MPLAAENWITCGNALRIDWLSVCPPTGKPSELLATDLFEDQVKQDLIDFENEGGETYICGNPPYKGSKWQTDSQKSDMAAAWKSYPQLSKNTDLVTGWIAKFLQYSDAVPDVVASFVMTNSVCQGQLAADIWPVIFGGGIEIRFAHSSFKWANLASHNAGVSVIVIGLGKKSSRIKRVYDEALLRECSIIGPYLVPDQSVVVAKANLPIGQQSQMYFGNMPRDGGHLILDRESMTSIRDQSGGAFVKKLVGAEELVSGKHRYCIWIDDDSVEESRSVPFINNRLKLVAENRLESKAQSTRDFASASHRFVQIAGTAIQSSIVVPRVSSENRQYLPVDLYTNDTIVSDSAFALYDAPLWDLSVLSSTIHLVWVKTVCGKLETRLRYSNTLGWNCFPLPHLTEKNKADLTKCAEDILLARESHFPATIADLYDPENMPANLLEAHERNDEILERIYIGRRFRNDTERLEKLFDLYTEMTKSAGASKKRVK